MCLQGGAECGKLLAGFQSPEALGGLHHAGGGPSERHAGVAPAFDVAADPPDGAVHVLDDVGAGKRAPEFQGQAEAAYRQDFIQPLEDARGHAGRLALEPAGEVFDQAPGLIGVVQFPGLA